VRPADANDIKLVHEWIHQPYAHRFWNMQVTLKELTQDFFSKRISNVSRQFLVCHQKKPIALVEVYHVIQTEVGSQYDVQRGDYGIHLLMAPPKDLLYLNRLLNKVSLDVLLTVTKMLFSNQSVIRIIAEPDIHNSPARNLAKKAGFAFLKDIHLSDKVASLFILSK